MKLTWYKTAALVLEEDGYLRRDLESLCDDISFKLNIETTEEELESILDVKRTSITDRDGTLDDHDSIRVVGDDEIDDFFDVGSVEVVLDGIIIGGSSNDHKVSLAIGGRAVEGGGEVTALAFLAEGWKNLGEVTFDVFVLYGADAAIYLINLFGDNINSDDFVMLGQQCGDGKAYIACTGYSNGDFGEWMHF